MAYNPDQERDEKGRFAGGRGGDLRRSEKDAALARAFRGGATESQRQTVERLWSNYKARPMTVAERRASLTQNGYRTPRTRDGRPIRLARETPRMRRFRQSDGLGALPPHDPRRH